MADHAQTRFPDGAAPEEQFRRVDEHHLESVTDENGVDSEWMTVRTRRVVHLREREAVDVVNRFSFLAESPHGETGNVSFPTEEDQEVDEETAEVHNSEEILEQETIVHSDEHPGAGNLPKAPQQEACTQIMEEQRSKQPRRKSRSKKRNGTKVKHPRDAEPPEDMPVMCKSSSLPDLVEQCEKPALDVPSLPDSCEQESDIQREKPPLCVPSALSAGAVAAFMLAANAINVAADKDSTSLLKCKEQQKINRRSTRRAASSAPRNAQRQNNMSQRGHRPQMHRPQMQRSSGPRR